MEGFKQRQAANIADEDRSTGGRGSDRAANHFPEVIDAGEILNHGIEDDGIEAGGFDSGEIVSQVLVQLYLGKLQAAGFVANFVERDLGKVRAEVVAAAGRQFEEQEAGSATDFPDGLRFQLTYSAGGEVPPAPHLVRGNRLAGVAAVPPDDVEAGRGIRRSAAVGLVIERLPFSDRFGEELLGVTDRPLHAIQVRDDISGEPFVARSILIGNDDGLFDGGMRVEQRLDFAQFNAEAAHLDLMVAAAKVFDSAIGPPAGQVAGSVQPRSGSGGKMIRQEALGSERGTVEISTREPGASDKHLARDANGHELAVSVEDVNLEVGDGAPNVALRAQQERQERRIGDMHGSFRDSVHVDEKWPRIRVAVEPRRKTARLQRFAAKDHEP